MPIHLQYFAEPDAGDTPTGSESSDLDNKAPEKENIEVKEKTFTRDDVAKMIAAETKKARTSWEKEQEERRKEAEKLAKMNAEDKLKHQLAQKDKEIDELKRNQTLAEMSKEASNMLTENELPVDNDLLELVVNNDAELTQKAVNTIISFASKIKKVNARQGTPSVGGKFERTKQNTQTTIAEMAKKARIVEK